HGDARAELHSLRQDVLAGLGMLRVAVSSVAVSAHMRAAEVSWSTAIVRAVDRRTRPAATKPSSAHTYAPRSSVSSGQAATYLTKRISPPVFDYVFREAA